LTVTHTGELNREDIDAALEERLIVAQFPHWVHLPVVTVEPGGWNNRTFRLGDDLSVRLPSGAAYADQVTKEQRVLAEALVDHQHVR
jgi:aminoglycoside phosphotransferase (APT) family kinase protein